MGEGRRVGGRGRGGEEGVVQGRKKGSLGLLKSFSSRLLSLPGPFRTKVQARAAKSLLDSKNGGWEFWRRGVFVGGFFVFSITWNSRVFSLFEVFFGSNRAIGI